MSNKKKTIIIIISTIFSISILKAQILEPYITIDPDGYTNVREQPNASSRIVGKVYKYEVFFSIDDYCGNGMYATGNWVPIEGNDAFGYMYEKYMLNVEELPMLTTKKNIKDKSGSGSIICTNDSLSITMQIRKSEKWHNIDERLKLKGMLHDSDVIKYMKDNGISDTEIDEIIILNIKKGVKMVLPYEKIKHYCNPHIMRVYLGRSSELYVYISGGSEACQYGVWLTLVNGEIIHQIDEYSC